MTSIEWVKNPDGTQGITWNPITGCLNHINGLCNDGGFPCYAYKLANTRLKQRYLANHNFIGMVEGTYPRQGVHDPFYPRFWEERIDAIWKLGRSRCAKARGIFVCDMGDLFGIGVPEEWTRAILEAISHAKPHRFYLLTKQPQNLIKFSPFPENCWVGVTVTGIKQFHNAVNGLAFACKGSRNVRFISFEPLLSPLNIDPELLPPLFQFVDWLIIGACTGTKAEMTSLARNHSPFLTEMPYGNRWTAQPNPEWVREIVKAADKAGMKVFLKNNLKPLLEKNDMHKYEELWQHKSPRVREFPLRIRQELPK